MSAAFPGALIAPPTASVQENLDALQAERDLGWDAEQLRSHEAFRFSLKEQAASRRMVRVGDVVSPFTLPEVDGGEVVLTDLLATGPVVLIFFRFEGCPACNAAWSAYNLSLAPALEDLGVHLVGVSPQVPEKLVAIKRRHDFQFQIASDSGASLIHEFGIGFEPTDEERERQRLAGKDIGAILGTGSWVFPYPTALVIDQDRVVRFADITELDGPYGVRRHPRRGGIPGALRARARRGESSGLSDLDLLVDMSEGRSLLDLVTIYKRRSASLSTWLRRRASRLSPGSNPGRGVCL